MCSFKLKNQIMSKCESACHKGCDGMHFLFDARKGGGRGGQDSNPWSLTSPGLQLRLTRRRVDTKPEVCGAMQEVPRRPILPGLPELYHTD